MATSSTEIEFNFMEVCKAPICPTAYFTVAPREWKSEWTL